MGRRRRGTPLHGWLIVDKPLGMSSAHAVARVQRLTNAAKAGHGGALDPLATGVLPIALGEATKTVAYAMDGAKQYRFTVRWGEARSTDDAEGPVTATSDHRPDAAAIEAVLPRFRGVVRQIPPAYSAIKVDGKRAYALARAGVEVALAARDIMVHDIALAAIPDPDHAEIEVTSGKGAYMRALARDIALALGTVGHIVALRRLRVGAFTEENAISLENLAAEWDIDGPVRHLLPVSTALDDIPALALTEAQAAYLKQGRPVRLTSRGLQATSEDIAEGDVLCATVDGRLVALARLEGGEICPVRVLNL